MRYRNTLKTGGIVLAVGAASPSNGFAEGKWGGYLGLPINYFAPFKLDFLPKDAPDGAYLPTYIREAGIDFFGTPSERALLPLLLDLSQTRPAILRMMRQQLEACYERFGAVKTLPPNPEYGKQRSGE